MPETLIFDHYEVLTREDGSPFELGRGAMGITYKAFDTSLRIPVALKVINGAYLNSEVARARFIREARSAAKLRHRHVASVFHLGIEGEAYFYAMEFIDGETVDALIKRQGALAPAVALQIAAQVARALNAGLQYGLVHRDLKPANLMLVREDDELVTKVIDFGLAKATGVGESEELSATLSSGGFVGTPHFASPEQLEEREIDVRSDIYSLGVTLWYMLCGQTPFAGSMAQVMSQHLSKPPPFERLGDLPAPLAGLLQRMLEKDPAARPQTPVELRREIEECAEAIAGGGSAMAAAVAGEENFATVLDDASREMAGGKFEAGATVAGRYEIIEDLGETNTGHVFHARDLTGGTEVRLLLLGSDLREDAATYTQLEREVERTAAVRHSNLLRVDALETTETASFIAMEWTVGFSLLELLRARRELHAEEVLALLAQAAEGVDAAVTAGLKRLDLALHQVFVHFGGGSVFTKEERLRQPVGSWPEFSVKLNPLGLTRELSASETWAGRQTIAAGASPQGTAGGVDTRTRCIQALATIAYELLGGTVAPLAFGSGGALRYTPLATLSEQGNDVLRRALDPARSYPSAREFHRSLEGVGVLEVKRHESTGHVSRTTPAEVAHRVPAPPSSHGSRSQMREPVAPPPVAVPGRPASRMPVAIFAIVLVTAMAGAAIYYFAQPPKKEVAAAVAPAPEEPPQQIDEVPPIPVPKPLPTPVPVPVPVPTPAPPPPPTRQDLLKMAISEADAVEAKEDWPACLRAWLKIAHEHPETDTAKVHLNAILENLRTRPDEVNAREFPALRELITEAANADILAAMMFLADEVRKTEPEIAFNWYSAASARGQVAATRQLGLMLSNGVAGRERDLGKAFLCFREAADKGDVAAKYLVGECYLRGKGVKRDERRAIEYLREAADGGNLYAMDLLGTCYHQGLGVEKDFKKAFELLSRAHERGYAVATGDLGVLYMKGDGVKADPKKAVELFLKGIAIGDGNCMFYYALCFEGGMGVGANQLKAQEWYKKAAVAGNRLAADWCRAHGIEVPVPK